MRGTIVYSVHKLDHTVQFSPRSTMAITVFPDSALRVIAPKGTSQDEVELRLRKRARWIIRQLMHFEQFRPRSSARRYVGGETHLYLGRQYRLKLRKGSLEEVKLKGAFLQVASPEHREPRVVKRLAAAGIARREEFASRSASGRLSHGSSNWDANRRSHYSGPCRAAGEAGAGAEEYPSIRTSFVRQPHASTMSSPMNLSI